MSLRRRAAGATSTWTDGGDGRVRACHGIEAEGEALSVDGRTGFIFLNRDGLPRVGGDYDRVFRRLRGKYAKKGKMELPDGMTPHTLRHTFCTEMAKAGMNRRRCNTSWAIRTSR